MSDFWVVNEGIGGVSPGIPGALPGKHAQHHITGGQDVIPDATPDSAGLLSQDDKVNLDNLVGTNGADYVNSTGVLGLIGYTVQELIEALKSYIDTHKNAAAPHSGHETLAGAQVKVDTHANLTTVHGATAGVVTDRIIKRDANGRAKVVAPSESDDIAIKGTVDTVQTNLDTHKTSADHDGRYYTETETDAAIDDLAGVGRTTETVKGTFDILDTHIDAEAPHSGHETPTGAQAKVDTHALVTSAHGATVSATANHIILRDAGGRAKVISPIEPDDIARKDTVDIVQANLNTHTASTSGVHGATSAAVSDRIIKRSMYGRAKVNPPLESDDIARKDTVDIAQDTVQTNLTTHTNLTSDVHGSTPLATASKIIERDANGRAKVTAPSANDDIAIKSTVDTVQTNLNTHVNLTYEAHGATHLPLPTYIIQRDTAGRAKVETPVSGDDIARKDTVDAVQYDLNTHKMLNYNAHSATPTATADRIISRDVNGRAKVVAPSESDDIAIKSTVVDAINPIILSIDNIKKRIYMEV